MHKTPENQTLWVTKYALSGGIRQAELSQSLSDDKYWYDRSMMMHFVMGVDCFQSQVDAVANAEARRKDKIASLQKWIAKLEKLKFEVKADD
jgi:hypothetical protein